MHPDTIPTPTPTKRPSRRWIWLFALLAAHLVLVAPGMVSHFASPERVSRYGKEEGAKPVPIEWRDADGYHLPTIDDMRKQWPTIDIVHYDAATAPGYHAFMSTIAIAAGGRTQNVDPLLWIVNLLVGLSLITTAFVISTRFVSHRASFFLTLPLASCSYVVASSTWLTTDNAALLFAALVLGGAASTTMTTGRTLRLGIYAALATSIRQSYAWLATPIVLAGVLASPLRRFAPAPFHTQTETSTRWNQLTFASLAAAMPLLIVGIFITLWGGLLPQSTEPWSGHHNLGPNLATPAFALSLIALFGVWYVPLVWAELCALVKKPSSGLLIAGIGFVAAVVVPTASTNSSFVRGTAQWKMRNYGALWQAADAVPTIADRSLLFAILAPAGALMLLLLYRAARSASRGPQSLILLLSLSGWLAAQTMNSMAWQRYFEPITLLALGFLAAMCGRHAWESARPMRRRLMIAGPTVLTIALLAITILKRHLPALDYAFG